MTGRPFQLDPPDWSQVSEFTHAVALPRSRQRKRPVSVFGATVISAPRPCWLDNVEAVARFKLNRLDCEQSTFVYGVLIERTSAHARLKYRVAGGAACNLENAVKQVVLLAREPEAVSESVRGSGVR